MAVDRTKLPFRKNCEGYFVDGKGNMLAKKSEHRFIIFPGGGINSDESIEEGIIRETFEETGASIKNLKHLGSINIVWDHNWPKTESQKRRYELFRGDEMHFFSGQIESFSSQKKEEPDSWQGNKLMKIEDVIKEIESFIYFNDDISEYRETQLRFLKLILAQDE